LIALINQCPSGRLSGLVHRKIKCRFLKISSSRNPVFGRLGDYCGVTKPDPIPNSAVKRSSADDTAP
jgi:hypothetical protein